MCFLPCASRQGRPFWPPAGDHEGRPYGAFAPIRKDWEARMAYHILLVDDAPELRRMVGELLEGAGYAVTLAADCAQARRAWTESQPDAALLDVMLPDGDGFSLLEELRRVENCVPVLFLSARDDDEAGLRGLGLGADDYITKPFSMRELLARVKANIRRMSMVPAGKGAAASANRMELGRVTVDTDQMAVLKDGQPLQLSQREYDLIRFLAAQPGKVFSREALMGHGWDYEGYVGDVRAVDVAVRRLREKIEDDPASPKFVVTKRGMGYYFGG